jgi:hypothetical protein
MTKVGLVRIAGELVLRFLNHVYKMSVLQAEHGWWNTRKHNTGDITVSFSTTRITFNTDNRFIIISSDLWRAFFGILPV